VIFNPDLYPATTTNPLNDDFNNNGWLDGEENQNLYGREDVGEKDLNRLNAKSLQHIQLLLFEK